MSVTPDHSKTYTFTAAPTSHVIRYWHGLCTAKILWTELFDEVSAGVFDTLSEEADDEWYVSDVTRHFDAFSPMFNGYLDFIEHGFSFEAMYTIEVAGVLDETFTMNPAYTFYIKPESGYVGVKNVHSGVVAIGDVAEMVEPALEDDLPAVLC